MTDISVARDQLKAIVARIERMNEEAAAIAEDVKAIYAEAKSSGYDVKILRKIIALRKKDDQERTEEELIMDTYLKALDMRQAELFE